MRKTRAFILAFACIFPLFLFSAKPLKQTMVYTNYDDQQLKMDIYSIEGEDNKQQVQPCLIFVFGGGFKEGKRNAKLYHDYFDYFANKGFKVVSIDYRLGMKGEKAPSMFNTKPIRNSIAIAVEDLYKATEFILANADLLKIDKSRVLISGSSAGAITVLQADYEKRNNLESSKILPKDFQYSGVISFAGSIFSTEGTPSYNIAPAPTLFFHGSADKLVPYDNSRFFHIGMFGSNSLAKVFRKNKYPYLFYSIEDNGHEVADYPMQDFLPEIDQFINDYIINGKKLLVDINYRDINRVPKKSDSPSDYYNR